ncbi:thioesterase II family protein [Streptomyces luteogriseus]|uniref:thioesterase II family protein n=1 Tax=Streptomyces luteogriseus TaxID=68233 RepID=UPI00160C1499|nr:alpha/beta fold hydrolase [Streptomyces luteogriseus]
MSAERASITPPYTNRETKREDALVGDWIRRFHPAPNAGSRLLCFPHAGGSASVYHALSAAVAGNIEPLIVQYPGRQERLGEPFAERAEEVAAAVLAALPAPVDGTPTILFGHSMGALLAFETARRLAAEGRAPAALFVSGRRGPSLPQWPVRRKPVSEMSDAELIEKIKQLSGTAGELLSSPDFLPLFLPPVRADYRIVDNYVYRSAPRLDCPVTVLAGDKDPGVTVEGGRAWESETRAAFSFHLLAGGHFFLDDHLPYLADLIASVLPERNAGQRACSTSRSDRADSRKGSTRSTTARTAATDGGV